MVLLLFPLSRPNFFGIFSKTVPTSRYTAVAQAHTKSYQHKILKLVYSPHFAPAWSVGSFTVKRGALTTTKAYFKFPGRNQADRTSTAVVRTSP